MKEIIFKAKCAVDNTWIYGIPAKNRQKQLCLFVEENSSRWGFVPINYKTLCQFIGLYDSNGHKIYEHDIIQFPSDDSRFPYKFEIVFDNETLSYLFCSEDGKYSYDEVIYLTKDFDNTVVVTGNKYD